MITTREVPKLISNLCVHPSEERTSRSDDHDHTIKIQLKLANRTEHERRQPTPSQPWLVLNEELSFFRASQTFHKEIETIQKK